MMMLRSFTNEDLTMNVNASKDYFIDSLVDIGKLTKEQGIDFKKNYALVYFEKGFWGKFYETFAEPPNKIGELYVKFVQIGHLTEKKE